MTWNGPGHMAGGGWKSRRLQEESIGGSSTRGESSYEERVCVGGSTFKASPRRYVGIGGSNWKASSDEYVGPNGLRYKASPKKYVGIGGSNWKVSGYERVGIGGSTWSTAPEAKPRTACRDSPPVNGNIKRNSSNNNGASKVLNIIAAAISPWNGSSNNGVAPKKRIVSPDDVRKEAIPDNKRFSYLYPDLFAQLARQDAESWYYRTHKRK